MDGREGMRERMTAVSSSWRFFAELVLRAALVRIFGIDRDVE